MKNKIIALALTLIMLISAMPLSVLAADELEVPEYFNDFYPNVGTKPPVRPVHQYIYRQNPPVFLWPQVANATSYDIVIYTDEELTEVYCKADKVTDNFKHFSEPFEKGRYYWWTYRYNVGTKSSQWSVARRFKVASDAVELLLPTADDIMKKIGGTHPYLFVRAENLSGFIEELKSDEYTRDYVENVMKKSIDNAMETGVYEEPLFYSQGGADSTARLIVIALCARVVWSSILYHYTGEQKYADFAVDNMVAQAKWEWQSADSPMSFLGSDVGFMRALGYIGVAFDWSCDFMSASDRKLVAQNLYDRVMSDFNRVATSIKGEPYNSHDYSCFQAHGTALAALLTDFPAVKESFNEFCEVLLSTYSPFSVEDGGYSKGMSYWADEFYNDNIFLEAFSFSGLYDFHKLPFLDNQYLWAIYMYPTVTSDTDMWGDAETGEGPRTERMTVGAARNALLADHPELIWWKNKMPPVARYTSYDGPLLVHTDREEGRAPVEYPRDWHFKDQGMTAMNSDLINEPRISTSFRSGAYGSYNHSHADQNSFIIESNGKHLAWRGGYYGYYGSSHHLAFSRASHAHNTITYDNGKGQPSMTYDFDADGRTTMYLSNTDMAACVGDAYEAYKGGLGKYDRTFIYMRPDSYIVIDNLAASEENIKENGGSTFEWWLNTQDEIAVHDDNRGVSITNDGEALDARIHYPENVTPFYSNLFSGPDLRDVIPHSRIENWEYHSRVWFQTEKVESTKIVATMDVHKEDGSSEVVKAKQYDNYMQIKFEDGVVAYISLATDESTMIDTGEFKFNGTAVVQSYDHLMFIGGTELYIRGEKVIEADRPVAVTIGFDEVGISSGDDYDVTIYPNDLYMPKVDSVRFRNDDMPVEIGMGVEYAIDEETGALKFHADKGHYSFLINDKPLPGEKINETWNYTLVIDGVEEQHTTEQLYYFTDYTLAATNKITDTALVAGGDYVVTGVEGEALYDGKEMVTNAKFKYDPSYVLHLTGDNTKIYIKTVKSVNLEVENTKDYVTIENSAAVIFQAEDFVSNKTGIPHVAELAFTCLAKLNAENEEVGYTVTIPEDGNYDFIAKYASGTYDVVRFFELNGDKYYFFCDFTGSYGPSPENYQVVRGDCNLDLKAGTYNILFGANGVGNLNIDWFGFIKN